jgi:hypothetical protein
VTLGTTGRKTAPSGSSSGEPPLAGWKAFARATGPYGGRAAVLLALGLIVLGVSLLGHRGGSRSGGTMTMIGDSLNLGTEPYLSDRLDGWTIAYDDVVGRTGEQGLFALQSMVRVGTVVVVSLGTNDSQTDAAQFRRVVGALLQTVGKHRCVVWSTIYTGRPNEALNAVLWDAAAQYPNLEVADWAGLVGSRPDLIAPDGIHGTPDGYAERAAQVAKLIERCRPAGWAS